MRGQSPGGRRGLVSAVGSSREWNAPADGGTDWPYADSDGSLVRSTVAVCSQSRIGLGARSSSPCCWRSRLPRCCQRAALIRARPRAPAQIAPARALSRALPLLARGPISAALGSESPAYTVARSATGLQAANPAQHLHASFARAGVSLRSGALDEHLRLRAVGYGGSLNAPGSSAPSARANRVLYRRGALSEWYVNGPLGLEQGFTVASAPAARPTGPLTLSIALAGNAHAALATGARSLTLSRAGSPSIRYGGLAATDARGRALHSWLELDAGRLLLRVDAAGAHYPLRIDPLIEQAKLEGGMVGEGHFGRSVALSADGSTALVGGPREEGTSGSVWVFTRSGATWTEQARLVGVKAEGAGAFFGRGVGLSADGNTAVIGDPGSEENVGAAWVFTRSGSTWTQRAKLVGTGETGAGQFGARVALSGDGGTALIGGFSDGAGVGAAWVFTGSEATWTQQAVLKGDGEVGGGEFGRSVALSFDGNTALVGALESGFQTGAAWVFARSGSTWAQQAELPRRRGGRQGRVRHERRAVRRRGHRPGRRRSGQRRRRRRVGVRALGLDVDPAGLQAHRRERREWRRAVRQQCGAVVWRDDRAERRARRQRSPRCGLDVRAHGRGMGAGRGEADRQE